MNEKVKKINQSLHIIGNYVIKVFLTLLLFTALKKVATSRVLNLSTSIYHYILRSTRFDIKGRAGDSDKKEPHGARDERGRGAAGQLVLGLYCCINRWRSAVTVKTSCPRGMPLTSPARHSRRNRPHYRLMSYQITTLVIQARSVVVKVRPKLRHRAKR